MIDEILEVHRPILCVWLTVSSKQINSNSSGPYSTLSCLLLTNKYDEYDVAPDIAVWLLQYPFPFFLGFTTPSPLLILWLLCRF